MYMDHVTPDISIFHFSAFVMDEFKRKYSNEDTLTVAIPHFWEHFDREGYSIWYSQYKYPEELTLTFKSCNLITGETRQQPLYKTLLVSVVSKVTLLLWLFIGWKANAEKALFSSLVLHLFVFAASCAGMHFLHLFRFAPMAQEQVGIRGSSVHMGIFLKVCRLLRWLSCSLKEGIRGDSAGTCYIGQIILNAS